MLHAIEKAVATVRQMIRSNSQWEPIHFEKALNIYNVILEIFRIHFDIYDPSHPNYKMKSTPLGSLDLVTPLVYIVASSYRLELNHDEITAQLCSLLSYHFQDTILTKNLMLLFENSDFVAVWSKIVSLQETTPMGILAYINGGRIETFPLRHANALMMRFAVSQESCLQLITSFPSAAEKESLLLFLSHNPSVLESLDSVSKTQVTTHLLSSLKFQFSLYPSRMLPFSDQGIQTLSLPQNSPMWCLSVLCEVCVQHRLNLESEIGFLKNLEMALATLVNSFASDEKGLKLHSLANDLGLTFCLPAIASQVPFLLAESIDDKVPSHFKEIINLETCPPVPKNEPLYENSCENSIFATFCKPGHNTRLLLQGCLLLSMRFLAHLIQEYDPPSDLTIPYIELHLVSVFSSLKTCSDRPALFKVCLTALERLISVYNSLGLFLLLQFILDSVKMDLSLVQMSSLVVRHILIHKKYPLTRDSICSGLVVKFCDFDNGSAVFDELKRLIKIIEPEFVIKSVQLVNYNVALEKESETRVRTSYPVSSVGYPSRHRNVTRAPSVHVDDFERLSLM